MSRSRSALLAVVAALLPGIVAAQQRALTAADYDRASRMLAQNLTGLVVGGSVDPNWLPDERMWYRSTTLEGSQIILVDPARRTRTVAFDHARVAAALSTAMGSNYTAAQLGQAAELSARGDSVVVTVQAIRWACNLAGTRCVNTGGVSGGGRGRGAAAAGGRGGRGGGGGVEGGRGGRGGGPPPITGVVSPDGTKSAFIRDWNLWVRDLATGQDRQLTTDGVKDFGYATDNAGWRASDRPMLLWSPDSRRIATQQQDERNVGEMYLVSTNVGHPSLRAWKYPLPGDTAVAMLHRVIIDVPTGRMVRLQLPPEYHRATLGDDISMNDYKWNPDGSLLALASTSRDHKHTVVRVADANTGAVRNVMEETVDTHFESRTGWRVLWATNEMVWYSQRDNWGQLYLYDLNTGRIKSRITNGEGPVTSIVRIDEETRTVWYAANGRQPGQDPYFSHFYRTGLDGGPQVALTPAEGTHSVQLSPSGRYLVDTYSKPDVPPVVELRDRDGRLVVALEKADISRLLATGWKPPIPIRMKGRDGTTDVYGMMFRPTDFDSTRRYPIVNNAYPGPQSGSVGSRAFTAARGDRQALAELGFIVVTIDGMGTPGRSKSFHDAYYGAMGRDNTLPDQVSGMKELASRHSWIDIDRAGMWGHSGGGFITVGALFHYPDFFKVGVSQSGNHDQRNYEDDWGERYQGLLVRLPDGSDSYAPEANQTAAANLKGKLLIAHGGMDNNVPPYNTYLVVDALIRANKDFDLLIFPNAAHGYGDMNNYMMRRRWDYFVKWLMGAEPPVEYQFRPAGGGRGGPPGS